MTTIIRNQKDLDNYISENGDYNQETNYFSQDKSGACFVIFGCTHASKAFKFVSDDYSLVITDDDYENEIDKQTSAANPELEGFYLK